MSEEAPKLPEPLDVHAIHQLVRLMKRYNLTAMDIDERGTKIRLRRRGPELPSPGYVISAPPVSVTPVVPMTQPPVAPPILEPQAPAGLVIESPMVGTYFSSGSPDSPAFVAVGSAIRPDTTVCVIEAMKVFTDIPAAISGTITEILVKNGQSVEFGQPLFRVNPA